MKILLILDRLFPTNHAFLESVYSQILPEKGYEIICLARTSTIKNKKIIKWNKIDVHLFNIAKKPSFFWKRFQHLLILKTAISLLNNNKFDIVQVRNWEFGSLVSILLKKLYGIKFIFQRSFPIDENYLFELNSGKLTLRQKFNKRILLAIYPIILKRADLIFAISNEMKKALVNQGHIETKIHSIGLAFDSATSNISIQMIDKIKEQLNIKKQKIILYFGKMDLKRNIEFLIEIYAKIRETHKNNILILLGGSEQDLVRLREYANKYNLDKHIKYINWVSRMDVANYIAMSYISLSPIPPISRYIVCSPTKLFESLGLGVPVICNDLPVPKEIISASMGGICVKYIKSEFAHAISYLLDNPVERNNMSERAKIYIRNNHTYHILADKIDKIYQTNLS